MLNQERLKAIESIELRRGGHQHLSDGMCVMEAVSYVAGEAWSDHPACACPIIAGFCVSWNDGMFAEERNRLLKPMVPLIVGTRSSNPLVEESRMTMAASWYIRVQAAAWLEACGYCREAEQLAALPEINRRSQLWQSHQLAGAFHAVSEHFGTSWPENAGQKIRHRMTNELLGRSAGRAASCLEIRNWSSVLVSEIYARQKWDSFWEYAMGTTLRAATLAPWVAQEATRTRLQTSAVDLLRRMIDCK